MGVVRRGLDKLLPQIDKRIDWRLDQKVDERIIPELRAMQAEHTRQAEAFAALAEDVAAARHTLSELRRWMIDDLEAANETTMLLGETLTRLQSSVDRLEQDSGVGGS